MPKGIDGRSQPVIANAPDDACTVRHAAYLLGVNTELLRGLIRSGKVQTDAAGNVPVETIKGLRHA